MSNSTFLKIVPSFLLRGVDPAAVYRKYLAGTYSNIRRQVTPKLKLKVAPITFTSTNTESLEQPVYIIKDKNGQPHVLYFSNQQEYERYNKNPVTADETKRICMKCAKEFTGEPERILISAQDYAVKDPKKGTCTKFILAYGEGIFHHPFCCYTAIMDNEYRLNCNRDPLMRDARLIYKNYCASKYPGLELREIDTKLLKRFGGPLEDEELFNNAHAYERQTNFIVVPVKVPYEKIKV